MEQELIVWGHDAFYRARQLAAALAQTGFPGLRVTDRGDGYVLENPSSGTLHITFKQRVRAA